MAKFKKGDRVRKTREDGLSYAHPIGSTGTVAEDGSRQPWVIWDQPHANGDRRFACYQGHLELIEPQPDRMAELEARVAELERALAAKPEPQQEPEFLEGRREHFDLLEDACVYNHSDGTGIYVHSDYEAVILPWPNTKGGTIIRFRRKQ